MAHLEQILQRQREALERSNKAEIDAQEARFHTESDACDKVCVCWYECDWCVGVNG